MRSTFFSIYSHQTDFLIGLLIGFLSAVLIALFWSLLRRRSARFEVFPTEVGQILVSRRALEEQIERYCEKLDDIGKCRAQVFRKNNLIGTTIQMRLRSDSQLVGISGYLQEQVEQVVRKNLGVEKVGPIDIVITGIRPVSSEKATNLTT